MTDAEKREAVKAMYPKSAGWARRVDRMSDAQVFAIFMRNQQIQSSKKDEDKDEGNPDIPF